MYNLPPDEQLPVDILAASFRNVTNSYKFFWFLAILEHVEENHSPVISIDQLLARMVARVWYPTNYFKLSFGKQDQLSVASELLRQASGMEPNAKQSQVVDQALVQLAMRSKVGGAIREIGRYVPTRFLRPFFFNRLTGLPDRAVDPMIKELAAVRFENPEQPCLYRFVSLSQPAIEIHEVWYRYLARHLAILNGFILWQLLNYLQRNNPNVSNLATKLFEPVARDLSQARKFWRLVLKHQGTLRCIYSGMPLLPEKYTLDHFLPWRFVAHDLLWNIAPVPSSVNSAKSDRLPDMELYYEGFARLQYEAVKIVAMARKYQLLEDYVILNKVESVEALVRLDYESFSSTLKDSLFPQVQVARNMGFSYGWRYQ